MSLFLSRRRVCDQKYRSGQQNHQGANLGHRRPGAVQGNYIGILQRRRRRAAGVRYHETGMHLQSPSTTAMMHLCVCVERNGPVGRARAREREKELTVHAMICTCVCVCVCERRLLLRISRDGSVSCANMPILRCVVVVTATWPCAHPHAHSPPRVCFSGSSNDTFTHASCRHPPCTCTDCHHARRQQG